MPEEMTVTRPATTSSAAISPAKAARTTKAPASQHGPVRSDALISPQNLTMVMELNSLRPIDISQHFTTLHLGCGDGSATAVMAAANPHATFIAQDSNPSNIARAQRLADETGLQNIRFIDQSPDCLHDADLPPCDFIVMDALYSHVSAAERLDLILLLRAQLKPGGVVALGYHTLPGQQQITALRELVSSHMSRPATGDTADTAAFLKRVQEVDTLFIQQAPEAGDALARLAAATPSALQAFAQDAPQSFYHTEVSDSLQAAQLAFAGPAAVINNFKRFTLDPKTYDLYKDTQDRSLAELIEDFARNTRLRCDVFHRGAEALTRPEHDALSANQRFCLKRPRQKNEKEFIVTVPGGTIRLDASIYAPILDAVSDAPRALSEIHQSNAKSRQLPISLLRQYTQALCALDYLQPAMPESGLDKRYAATDRFNRTLLQRNLIGKGAPCLASPVTGTGIPVDSLTQLFLSGLQEEVNNIATYAKQHLRAAGITMQREGKVLISEAEIDAELQARTQRFYTHDLPFFAQMGVV